MAEIDLTKFLDRAHEKKTLKEILQLPTSALQGLSEQDAEALKSAFGIGTIEDTGRSKYFKIAQSILDMAEFGHR
jgi:hypothetical protein